MPYCMQQKISSEGLPSATYYRKAARPPNPPKTERQAFTADATARYAAANGPDVAAVKKEKLLVVQGRPAAAEEI